MQRNSYLSSTHFHLPRRRVSSHNVIVSMYLYKQNELNGSGTAPQFKTRMHFCVPTDVIFVELKVCSNNKIRNDESGHGEGHIVWVLEIPTTDTQIGTESKIFSYMRADLVQDLLVGMNCVKGGGIR